MMIARHGCTSQVVEVDGRHTPITAEALANRIDLILDHDIVTTIGLG